MWSFDKHPKIDFFGVGLTWDAFGPSDHNTVYLYTNMKYSLFRALNLKTFG